MLRALAAVAVAILASGCTGSAEPVADAPNLPRALLGPETTSIVLEVSAVGGRMPTRDALDHAKSILANVTDKTVIVTGPTLIPAQGGDYDEQDLDRIHAATSFFTGPDGFVDGQRVVLHVLYLDGRMAVDGEAHLTLGRSLLADGLIAIFRDTYGDAHRWSNGTRLSAVAEMDRHVLLHEVGHALGLVNNGVPMLRDHAAEGHPGHSRYPESVMYHHPPMTPDQLVSGTVSTTFDVDDLADLAAYHSSLTI